MNNEITVKLKCNIEEICKILENKEFQFVEKYLLDDSYYIPSTINIKDMSEREILSKAIILRNIEGYIPKYQEYGKPKALLYTIARNLCFNWTKKKKIINITSFEEESIATRAADEIDKMIDSFELHNYINELSAEQQEMLFLRYFEELQIGEIAKILDISRFSVMYRIRIATNRLKSKMGVYNDEK